VGYVRPLVVTGRHSPEVLEPVDGALDLIAASVVLAAEAGGSATCAAPASAVGALVFGLRNGVLDLASSQVAAVSTGAVCFIAAHVVGPSAGPPSQRAGHPNLVQDVDHLRGVAPLPRHE
jgi:hypothetical protein